MNSLTMKVTQQQHNTILAALRLYQNVMETMYDDEPPKDYAEIATNGGEDKPLNADDIDTLCEALNSDGDATA